MILLFFSLKELSFFSETEPLRIIEVQTGTCLEEDDIQSLDDDYSRS